MATLKIKYGWNKWLFQDKFEEFKQEFERYIKGDRYYVGRLYYKNAKKYGEKAIELGKRVGVSTEDLQVGLQELEEKQKNYIKMEKNREKFKGYSARHSVKVAKEVQNKIGDRDPTRKELREYERSCYEQEYNSNPNKWKDAFESKESFERWLRRNPLILQDIPYKLRLELYKDAVEGDKETIKRLEDEESIKKILKEKNNKNK